MGMVIRRARAARGLLLAATGATLVATLLLTGLADYGRDVVEAGARGVVDAARPQERSLLVQGAAGTFSRYQDGAGGGWAEKDRALRERFAGGFAGLDVRIADAGYAAGRQLTGDVGDAVPDGDGLVFASVAFLAGLADHADLLSGTWPRAAATPRQAALAEAAAATLHLSAGDRVQITDRFTGKRSVIEVTGVWRPRDMADAYWRLAPGAATGVLPHTSTYGPFVVPREDFLAGYATNASLAWLIEPDLHRVQPGRLDPVREAIAYATDGLRDDIGLGSSGLVSTHLDRLLDRLDRADLVGRSALVTPILLVVVLGGYALVLMGVLLSEHRRGEAALLRARGAARHQLAGLAAREAALVVLPAAVLAPPLAVQVLRHADPARSLTGTALELVPRLDRVTWLVAVLAVAGCAVAMVGQVLRGRGSYVAELAERSRPGRWAVAQRAGLDLALVVLAVLAWLQLRQYSSPLAGERVGGALSVDPLLAAAPTIGVLAGTVVALRLLPPLTRLAERFVQHRAWTATTIGMWQAGRRPHAGPVLLLALAVGAGALAWCLVGTSQRSVRDQADHAVGADLRLVEQSTLPPPERAGEVAALPGVEKALPVRRDELVLGAAKVATSLVALDAAEAAPVVCLRDDLAGGSPAGVFAALAGSRVDAAGIELAGDGRLTGEVRASTTGGVSRTRAARSRVETAAVFALSNGRYREVPLGATTDSGRLRFSVALPDDLGPRPRLAGFLVDASGPPQMDLTWQLGSLRAGATPVDPAAAGQWQGHDDFGKAFSVELDGPQLKVGYHSPVTAEVDVVHTRLAIAPGPEPGPVPMVATPQAMSALRLGTGDRIELFMGNATIGVRLVGTVEAVPGTTQPSALMADLPSLAAVLFRQYGSVRNPQEWWLATAGDPAAPAAAARLNGVQVLDRRAAAEAARTDPYGVGARAALFAAALGGVVLAAMGIAVDVRATARRRANELAVLHTLGAGPRLLARSLIAEHAFLAGLGVLVGVGVGIGVAAAMAPLVVLTPTAERPVPAPLLEIAWLPVAATAAGLFLLALVLSAMVAWTARRRLAAAQLRIGDQL